MVREVGLLLRDVAVWAARRTPFARPAQELRKTV